MESEFLEQETLSKRKLDILYYKSERLKENYLLKFPNRTNAQAERYAERRVKQEIKLIDSRIAEING